MSALNKKIQVIDVGPRDGFQNVKTFIDTEEKIKIIDGLYEAGVRAMEITSFVSPKAIPQMKDASQVAKAVVEKYKDLQIIALVPNLRGAQNAWDSGVREVAVVISASEAHNKANINRQIAESVEGLRKIREALPELKIHLDVAVAFGCPFSGKTPEKDVLSLVGKAVDMGITDITLCDTIGVANPVQVKSLLKAVQETYPGVEITLHFHNTRGLGLANIFAAIEMGVTRFETSVGGLGGCPFAPGSEGNTSTEDTLNMLQEMDCETGIDMNKYLETVKYVSEHVDAPLTGKMLRVLNSSCMNVSGKAS